MVILFESNGTEKNLKKLEGHAKSVRGANPYGFFAEFLWVLNHLEYCLAENKIPVIYWGPEFAYYSPQGYNQSLNGWEYYFEPVSTSFYQPSDVLHKECFYSRSNNFSTLWWYNQYIEEKKLLSENEQQAFKPIEDHEYQYQMLIHKSGKNGLYPTGTYHLYDYQFRKFVKTELIDRFIKIKPSIKEKIEKFYHDFMSEEKTVGIHLRGNHLFSEVLPVPLNYIFEEVKKYSEIGYQCFIATDQLPLIQEAENNLNCPVIYYECERFNQTTSPWGNGKKLHPKLGEDILIEMILLSRCEHLIHTLSNVSTAALYFNPELSHTLIY